MAGGIGERFWPLSTVRRPKQMLDLTGSGRTLLEQAISRVSPVVDEVYISTSETLAPAMAGSGLVPESCILAEPAKRNTAGALVWSMAAIDSGEPFVAAITTADHAIDPDDAFAADASAALDLAEREDVLVTLGIRPDRPETGYGYIEMGTGAEVLRFREKPDAETAAKFLAQGNFLWNSGMFFWRSDTFQRELEAHAATHGDVLRRLIADPNSDVFSTLPNVSIDYALMEKSQRVRCLAASFSWDDVGTWDSLLRTVPLDGEGNAVIGSASLIDSANCVVYNDTDRTLCLVGVRDSIVVATAEAFLTVPLSHAQDVRKAAAAHSQ